MLNVGMSELLVFAVIALLVLGPEKLPEGARFVGKWYGKLKRFTSKVQNEIDQELKLSEFRAEMQQEIDRLTELEIRMHKQLDALKNKQVIDSTEKEKPKQSLSKCIYKLFTQPITPFSTQFLQTHINTILQANPTAQTPLTLKIAV